MLTWHTEVPKSSLSLLRLLFFFALHHFKELALQSLSEASRYSALTLKNLFFYSLSLLIFPFLPNRDAKVTEVFSPPKEF
jgi:hypothetical protein